MKKSRFSEEKIIAVLKQAEASVKVSGWSASTASRMPRSTTERPSKVGWTSPSCGV